MIEAVGRRHVAEFVGQDAGTRHHLGRRYQMIVQRTHRVAHRRAGAARPEAYAEQVDVSGRHRRHRTRHLSGEQIAGLERAIGPAKSIAEIEHDLDAAVWNNGIGFGKLVLTAAGDPDRLHRRGEGADRVVLLERHVARIRSVKDSVYTPSVLTRRRKRVRHPRPAPPRSAAERLAESERLFREFAQLTPYPYPKGFTKSFSSWAEYERWRRAQTNPWLR